MPASRSRRCRRAATTPCLIGYQAISTPCGQRRAAATSASATRERSCFLLFVGRIDQREPAFFRRRQQGAERLEAVAAVHADARVMAELAAQRIGFRGLEFAERRAVLGAQQRGRDERRSGIGHDARSPRVETPHDLEIARDRGRIGRDRRGREPMDAAARFGGAADLVAAAPRMRVEDEERPLFFREPHENGRERDVLHHVGEIPGVEGVAVLHASPSQSRGRR